MKTVPRTLLVSRLNDLLSATSGRDSCPNGVQVEGCEQVGKVAFGVTASLRFLTAATAWGAHAAIVHHGLFWDGKPMRIERTLKQRLSPLFSSDCSLLAYHLPLDRHPTLGNNSRLAAALGAERTEPGFLYDGLPIGVIAEFVPALPLADFVARVRQATRRDPLVEAAGPATIARAGIVSGAAHRLLDEAARLGLDLYLTGEPAESAIHLAREERINFIAAGHHATERFGVQALAEWVAQEFGIETKYFEDENPV